MLARDRYLDTPTNSPVYPRYMAQLGERTQLKFLIADFPTADVVEVVHCKDCKHRIDDEDFMCKHYCMKRHSNGGRFCEDNDFCSYGERR